MYSVKEIFYTLQGEGANAGRPAVFCRFTGCNLWSGRERDRDDAICKFCDTDFVGTDGPNGGKFTTPEALVATMRGVIREDAAAPDKPQRDVVRPPRMLTVLTGGEPMLQVNMPLIRALHDANFEIAVETNGTLPVPGAIDWICVSPKNGTTLSQVFGDELKLVYPQQGLSPDEFDDLAFTHRYLQPMDGPSVEDNTKQAIAYCKRNPKWRLSLQTHKMLGIS